ncbi:MAG: hypothetical protein WBE38_20595 [Terracidiphilus sp.]|jgi:hypothetical protein
MSNGEGWLRLLSPFRWYVSPRADGESVILWWEKRRIPYNVFVFLFTLPFCFRLDLYAMGFLSTNTALQQMYQADGSENLLIQALLQILSNVWYTGGWMVELIVKVIVRRKIRWFGPIALITGTVFSFFFEAFWLR